MRRSPPIQVGLSLNDIMYAFGKYNLRRKSLGWERLVCGDGCGL